MKFSKINLFVIIAFFVLCFLFSCSKDNTSSNTSSTTSPVSIVCSFFPYKNGNKMEESIFGRIVSFTYKDTIINNIKYFVSSDKIGINFGPTIDLLRSDTNGNVVQYFLPKVTSFCTFLPHESIVLKPKDPVVYFWEDSTIIVNLGNLYSYKHKYKILKNGFTDTILGKSYSNCIVLKLENNVYINGSESESYTNSYFWACGYGFYKIETDAGLVVSKISNLSL